MKYYEIIKNNLVLYIQYEMILRGIRVYISKY